MKPPNSSGSHQPLQTSSNGKSHEIKAKYVRKTEKSNVKIEEVSEIEEKETKTFIVEKSQRLHHTVGQLTLSSSWKNEVKVESNGGKLQLISNEARIINSNSLNVNSTIKDQTADATDYLNGLWNWVDESHFFSPLSPKIHDMGAIQLLCDHPIASNEGTLFIRFLFMEFMAIISVKSVPLQDLLERILN
jgi:hypothetical protein